MKENLEDILPRQMFSQYTQRNSKQKQFACLHTDLDTLLQHTIREQLQTLTMQHFSEADRCRRLRESFAVAIECALSNQSINQQQLEPLFEEMYSCSVQSMAFSGITEEQLTLQYICPTGLLMSVHNSKHTIKDIYRIRSYARGLHQVIEHKLKHQNDVSILYPACGPFAPLVLPLFAYYKNHRLYENKHFHITLIDAQRGAVLVLKQLIKDLKLDVTINLIEQDACTYETKHEYDVLLLEALQHGFTQEGHLSIAKHLVKFLKVDGTMLPEKIQVKGILVHGETEFNQQWKSVKYTHSSHQSTSALKDRVEVGTLMEISKSSLLKMKEIVLNNGAKVIPARSIILPQNVSDISQRILAIYAQIHTYHKERINAYDSGITHPKPDMDFYVDSKPLAIERTHFIARSGEKINFYYRLSGLPGFVATK
ncbi:hypothetical protein ACPV4X_19490 [Vibrio owensii]|uniref:hypothetical protein n=1 Tax=Vibrio owensii TaxID=696485 RepID=UPI00406758F8